MRPSRDDVCGLGEPDVVFGARQARSACGGVERAAAVLVGRHGNLRLGEQPQDVALAIVGGANAACPSSARA